MKVFDCFMFFNELDLLEIRLNELKNVVDHFVICEATTTLSGKPKPLYFADNADRFSEFADRITCVISHPPDGIDSWGRERYQRSSIKSGLHKIDLDDIVMLSDLDEIPKASAVKDVITNRRYPCSLVEELRYLYVDWKAEGWTPGTTILTKAELDSAGNNLQLIRDRRGSFSLIENGGWHFSYLGGIYKTLQKLHSFAHTEFSHMRLEDVQKWFDARETQFSKPMTVEMPSGPRYLLDNREKFAHFFSPENR